MMFEYEINEDNGRKTFIWAESRNDAIRMFIEEKGCPIEFVKKHCLVKCNGRVK